MTGFRVRDAAVHCHISNKIEAYHLFRMAAPRPPRERADDDPPLFSHCFTTQRLPGPGVKKLAKIPCRGVPEVSQAPSYVSDREDIFDNVVGADAIFSRVLPARQGKHREKRAVHLAGGSRGE